MLNVLPDDKTLHESPQVVVPTPAIELDQSSFVHFRRISFKWKILPFQRQIGR